MERERPFSGEREPRRRASFAKHLPVAVDPPLEREPQYGYVSQYRPNAVFLAHLIATRDTVIYGGESEHTQSMTGASRYRATAALPRRRTAGRLINTER
ncbi:hypothetical protein FMN50_17355 [Rhodobacterales bacterium]|nr:hypothetical protein FMN50_17355 [Rhodobacterales bacterium]